MRGVVIIPIAAELLRPFEERFGVTVVTGYGLSEAGQIVFSSVDEPAPAGTSGPVVPQYEVLIVDENDHPVPAGLPGEIIVRPREPHLVFEGFCGDPVATLKVLRNLWLHTGDIGSIDEDGQFRFLDRKKDYLRRRGENISSYEVEQAVLQHEDVLEVAVVGVASELSEEEVKACVVLKPGATLTEEALLYHCVENMPYYAVPRFILFLDELPRNAVNRVQKFVLRDGHTATPGWDREAAGIRVTRTTASERRRKERESHG